MNPKRKCVVNGFRVEEYVWGDVLVVYVDCALVSETYKQACEMILRDERPTRVKR